MEFVEYPPTLVSDWVHVDMCLGHRSGAQCHGESHCRTTMRWEDDL